MLLRGKCCFVYCMPPDGASPVVVCVRKSVTALPAFQKLEMGYALVWKRNVALSRTARGFLGRWWECQ
ncbi:hypothetical protein [Ruminococcus sp.]